MHSVFIFASRKFPRLCEFLISEFWRLLIKKSQFYFNELIYIRLLSVNIVVPRVSFPLRIDIEGTEREYLEIARVIRSNDTCFLDRFLTSDIGARQGAVSRS